MPKKPEAHSMLIGIAWFDRKQWKLLAEVVPDRNALDDSFEVWKRSARKTMKGLTRSGQTVEKVPIQVDELLTWCTLRGVVPDGKARSQFVSEILQKKHAGKS